MIAKINWLDSKRFIPDIRVKYCPIIKFTNEETCSWSAEIHIIKNDLANRKSIAEVHYLFSNAPTSNICEGNQFELFEGNRKVADGIFIDDKSASKL